MTFRIKEARERIGLSQKELALSIVIKSTIFNWYKNGTHNPKPEVLRQIAIKCETAVDFILGLMIYYKGFLQPFFNIIKKGVAEK